MRKKWVRLTAQQYETQMEALQGLYGDTKPPKLDSFHKKEKKAHSHQKENRDDKKIPDKISNDKA